MTKIFITSDSHFFHKNIIKYQPKERPFADVHEMNEVLVEKWNSVVGPNDEIYHLGDFGFAKPRKIESILQRLNGRKYYIFGNHDRTMRNQHIAKYFEWMRHYHELKHRGNHVVMFHYPIHSWNRIQYGAYHLHGHLHNNGINEGRRFDIGVDGHDLYPWDLEELIMMLEHNTNHDKYYFSDDIE